MSDDKPTPLRDVAKGLGLLFRAAKTAVDRLPKKDLEEVVLTSAREVGRAIENVATTVGREVRSRIHPDRPTPAEPGARTGEAEPSPPSRSSAEAKPDDPKKPPPGAP